MRTIYKKLLCTALALALLVAGALAVPIDDDLFAEPSATPSPTAVAVESAKASSITDDGVLRVCLKSLGAPERLTVTLDGEYTVEHDAGFRFERGTQIVLSLGDGNIYLSVSGLTISMGTSLALTRQATGQQTNGMYIEETGNTNLYSGDLYVSLAEGGGMCAILYIDIEEYLLGVIGYEMSDSWPLEALKAQAVAARTYALGRKKSATGRDYDVVDTTGDQVFRGTDDTLTNVRAAVEATRGIVLIYKGNVATAYFTASNGGEVALPSDVWGGSGDYDYIERKDDPYDLANPKSIVNSIAFLSDLSDCDALRSMLETALADIDKDAQIVRVLSVTPVDPVPADSKMYTKLRFELCVSTLGDAYEISEADIGAPSIPTGDRDADAALRSVDYLNRIARESPYELKKDVRVVSDESVFVELSVYEQIKDGLALGINSSDCELVSVEAAGDTFVIMMRRYGHGVGMSQRGAQRMAGVEGFYYDQILTFYYPGADIEQIDWNTPALESLDDLSENVGFDRPEPTATPTPAPLRALESGEYYATVRLGDAASALNVREAPGTHNPVVTTLVEGRQVIVMTEADANGWVQIDTGDVTGYAKLEYLAKE